MAQFDPDRMRAADVDLGDDEMVARWLTEELAGVLSQDFREQPRSVQIPMLLAFRRDLEAQLKTVEEVRAGGSSLSSEEWFELDEIETTTRDTATAVTERLRQLGYSGSP